MAGGEQTTEFRMRPGAGAYRHKYIRGCCIAALVLLVIAIAAHGSALETFLGAMMALAIMLDGNAAGTIPHKWENAA